MSLLTAGFPQSPTNPTSLASLVLEGMGQLKSELAARTAISQAEQDNWLAEGKQGASNLMNMESVLAGNRDFAARQQQQQFSNYLGLQNLDLDKQKVSMAQESAKALADERAAHADYWRNGGAKKIPAGVDPSLLGALGDTSLLAPPPPTDSGGAGGPIPYTEPDPGSGSLLTPPQQPVTPPGMAAPVMPDGSSASVPTTAPGPNPLLPPTDGAPPLLMAPPTALPPTPGIAAPAAPPPPTGAVAPAPGSPGFVGPPAPAPTPPTASGPPTDDKIRAALAKAAELKGKIDLFKALPPAQKGIPQYAAQHIKNVSELESLTQDPAFRKATETQAPANMLPYETEIKNKDGTTTKFVDLEAAAKREKAMHVAQQTPQNVVVPDKDGNPVGMVRGDIIKNAKGEYSVHYKPLTPAPASELSALRQIESPVIKSSDDDATKAAKDPFSPANKMAAFKDKYGRDLKNTPEDWHLAYQAAQAKITPKIVARLQDFQKNGWNIPAEFQHYLDAATPAPIVPTAPPAVVPSVAPSPVAPPAPTDYSTFYPKK